MRRRSWHGPALAGPVIALALAVTQLLSVGVARADAPADTTPPVDSTTTTAPVTPPPTTPPTAPPTPIDPAAPVAPPLPTLQPGDSGPPPAPLPDPSPHIRQLLAQLELIDGQKGVTFATQASQQAHDALSAASAIEQRAQASVIEARRNLTFARHQLGSVAAVAYMGAGGGVLSSLTDASTADSASARELMDSSIEHHGDIVRAASRHLSTADRDLHKARDDVAAATTRAGAADTAVGDAQATLTAARRDSASRNPKWQLSIEGDTAFTAQELTLWYLSQNRTSHTTVPIDQLIGFYVSEGEAEGVRGDMAFAQALVETGSFGNPDTINLNNFAGIGHCDSSASGFHFDTAQLGVRGQMQLLKSYAEKSPNYANPLVDSRLHGPAGCCQTWTQLTHVWASDPNYGPKILSVYEGMLEWLITARTAETGPPPALVVSSSLTAESTTTTAPKK